MYIEIKYNMKKILLFIIIIFLISAKIKFVFAADAFNEQWTCLDSKVTTEDKSITPVTSADPTYMMYTHSGVIRTKGIKAENPLPNSNTYIVECVQIPTKLQILDSVKNELNNQVPKEVCTTGDSATDMYIWNNDRLKLIQKIFSYYDHCAHWLDSGCKYLGYDPDGYYKFDLKTKLEPENTKHYFKTDSQGNFTTGPFVYSNVIIGGAARKFMAYNRFASVDLPMGKGGEQQATFTFEGASKDCVTIAWDPYGRVFDSQTLQPINRANVVLLKKDNSGPYIVVNSSDVRGGFIENPQTTKENGWFSFIVPDGTYQLKVTADGYKFPNTASVQSNYKKIYSDLYNGNDIVQKGKMIHKDIPLDPVDNKTARSFPATIIGIFQRTLAGGETVIDGSVSHPFAKITAFCKKTNGSRGTLNKIVQADKMGSFKLSFNPYKCDQNSGEMYGIVEVEAVDLTINNFDRLISRIKEIFFKPVVAEAATSYSLDPIPNYIEGYAKDSQGKVLPNTKVGVYAIGDSRPYRTVTTDAKGYFKIASDNLPISPYELRYIPVTGNTVKISTTQFISQNLTVIKKNKINLYSYRPSSIVNAVEKKPESPNPAAVNSRNSLINNNNSQQKQTNNYWIFIIVIIFVLMLAVGVMLWFYLQKKKAGDGQIY